MAQVDSELTTPVRQQDWGAWFAAALADVPLVRILRGLSPEDAVAAARESWQAGVGLVEVTLERPAGAESLAAVVAAAEGRHPVGAGTVTTPERLARARAAGAGFAIAPGLDGDTVAAAAEHGVPFLPGVATPSEVGQAVRMGVTTVKAFPAVSLGPAWFGAVPGPFPEVALVATGGVTAETAGDFLAAGAVAVGVGSGVRGGALATLVEAVRHRR